MAADLPKEVTVHDLQAGSQVDPRNIAKVRKILQDPGFDVVHTQSPVAGPLVRLAARSLPSALRPVVVSTEQNVHTRVTGLPGIVNGLTLRLSDAITNVSDAVLDSYFGWERPYLRSSDIRTIHNAVPAVGEMDPSTARTKVRERHGLASAADDLVLIGNVARIDPQKGQGQLLEAVARLGADVRANCHLLIVGNGVDSGLGKELQARCRSLGIADAVTFTGPVDDVDVYLNALDVFAMPSLHEGFSLAVLEAMSAGLPVLATRIAPLVEALGDAAVYVDSDPERIAAGLEALIGDPEERVRLGELAEDRHASLFTDVAMAEQYEDLYEELLVRQGRIAGMRP